MSPIIQNELTTPPDSRLFTQVFIQAQIKKASKPRVTGLCEGNSPSPHISLAVYTLVMQGIKTLSKCKCLKGLVILEYSGATSQDG